MNPQFEIIFLHSKENNRQSQAILEDNSYHLESQCKKLLRLLKEGRRLTVRSAMFDYGISSLPRRVLDLKKSGIEVKSELINGRFKEYYI